MDIKKQTPTIKKYDFSCRCPFCGKLVNTYHHDTNVLLMSGLLDMSLEQQLSDYAFCECGALVWTNITLTQEYLQLRNSPPYHEICNNVNLSATEKKLQILTQLNLMPLTYLYIHLMHERSDAKQEKEYIAQYIAELQRNGHASSVPVAHYHTCFDHLSRDYLTDKMMIVDLLRISGQFYAARKALAKLYRFKQKNGFYYVQDQLISNQSVQWL